MSQINIRNLSNENDDGSPEIVGVSTFSTTSYFVPPKGTTAERPSDCEPGSIRFNTDTTNLEYFRGDTIGWSQFELINPNLGGGTGSNTGLGSRAVFGGGGQGTPNFTNAISFLTISTLGNSQDFGDMTYKAQFPSRSHVSSTSRGILFGGGSPGAVNIIDFITMATTGNAVDFGDTLSAKQLRSNGITSDCIRALTAGYSFDNVIEFVEIASTGNSQDFGDLTVQRFTPAALSNGHGGL